MKWINTILAYLLPVSITADVPFNAKWNPVADTVSYKIKVDGEQIGADIPAFFPTNVNWVFTHTQAGMHIFEVFSINMAGVATAIPVTIDGKPSSPGLTAPYNMRLVLYVEVGQSNHPIISGLEGN